MEDGNGHQTPHAEENQGKSGEMRDSWERKHARNRNNKGLDDKKHEYITEESKQEETDLVDVSSRPKRINKKKVERCR